MRRTARRLRTRSTGSGHLQWRTGDTKTARATFTRLLEAFPASGRAPAAMFDIGRAYEDDSQWDLARAQYLRLVRSYPHSDEAADGRFRAPFALYMLGQFDAAAREFASMKPMAASPSERDGLSYWHARSMERSGQSAAANAIYQSLAQSTASNYYPELAARRIGAPTAQLAAEYAVQTRGCGAVGGARQPRRVSSGPRHHVEAARA